MIINNEENDVRFLGVWFNINLKRKFIKNQLLEIIKMTSIRLHSKIITDK